MEANTQTMRSLLQQALDAWPQFDDEPTGPLLPGVFADDDEDRDVNGGDMVEWFGEWRLGVKAALAAPADPVQEAAPDLLYHLSEVIGTADEWRAMPVASLQKRMFEAVERARAAVVRAGGEAYAAIAKAEGAANG